MLAALPLAMLFAACGLALGVFARSTKEGNYYMVPMFFVVLPLAYWSMTPGIELDGFTSWVPVANALLLQQRLMAVRPDPFPWQHVPAVVVSLAACIAVALWFAVWQFHRESVLFREAEAGRRRGQGSEERVSFWRESDHSQPASPMTRPPRQRANRRDRQHPRRLRDRSEDQRRPLDLERALHRVGVEGEVAQFDVDRHCAGPVEKDVWLVHLGPAAVADPEYDLPARAGWPGELTATHPNLIDRRADLGVDRRRVGQLQSGGEGQRRGRVLPGGDGGALAEDRPTRPAERPRASDGGAGTGTEERVAPRAERVRAVDDEPAAILHRHRAEEAGPGRDLHDPAGLDAIREPDRGCSQSVRVSDHQAARLRPAAAANAAGAAEHQGAGAVLDEETLGLVHVAEVAPPPPRKSVPAKVIV